jgi:hypothetical protein
LGKHDIGQGGLLGPAAAAAATALAALLLLLLLRPPAGIASARAVVIASVRCLGRSLLHRSEEIVKETRQVEMFLLPGRDGRITDRLAGRRPCIIDNQKGINDARPWPRMQGDVCRV